LSGLGIIEDDDDFDFALRVVDDIIVMPVVVVLRASNKLDVVAGVNAATAEITDVKTMILNMVEYDY